MSIRWQQMLGIISVQKVRTPFSIKSLLDTYCFISHLGNRYGLDFQFGLRMEEESGGQFEEESAEEE